MERWSLLDAADLAAALRQYPADAGASARRAACHLSGLEAADVAAALPLQPWNAFNFLFHLLGISLGLTKQFQQLRPSVLGASRKSL